MSVFKQIGKRFGKGEAQPESEALIPVAASVVAARSGEVVNDAASYGVAIVPATVRPGAWYWRVVRVHHLTPEENHGNHHIFIDVLDPERGTDPNALGARVYYARAKITWEGGEQIVTVDKPAGEPGTNFPMWKWQVCTVYALGLLGRELPADQVTGLHTGHPDEAEGNTLFHHSFGLTYVKSLASDLPPIQSVIFGKVIGGTGRIAVLLRGEQTVARQTIAADETFRFTDLAAGTYIVALEGSDLRSQPLAANGTDQVQIELALSSAASVLSGQVHNGDGHTVTLYRDGVEVSSAAIGPDETYRFAGLTAGTYQVQVAGTAISAAATLDGANSAVLDLEVPVVMKPLAHYVLFGPAEHPATEVNLLLAQQFITAFGLSAGFSPDEAARAALVTIIAAPAEVGQEVEAALVSGGARVQRITGTVGEVAAALAQRVGARQPFI